MIIHKPDNAKLPHEGLEYYRHSKEPETIQECAKLFCWYCIHDTRFVSGDFGNCKNRNKLKGDKMNAGFYCIDCGKEGRDTLISREQAIKTGEIYGRGLCETHAFMAKPRMDAQGSAENVESAP